MNPSFEQKIRDLVVGLGVAERSDIAGIYSLTGGVSSDIARVVTPKAEYCAKFALAQLKVEADWQAPVHRNAAEYAWLEFVSTKYPTNVPVLYGRSSRLNGFVMECLKGDEIRLWKSDLLKNGPKNSDAGTVAEVLGGIHNASTERNFQREAFENASDFFSLRLEPYFFYLQSQYPQIMKEIEALIKQTSETQRVLIHGDVSPKNILFRGDVPVFLDAECATMGDPAFDVGFCMNHLILKALHLPKHRSDLFKSAILFWESYKEHITWEAVGDCEGRLLQLLPLLMLARVDSKSPVEYLSEHNKTLIRKIAVPFIKEPAGSIEQFIESLSQSL